MSVDILLSVTNFEDKGQNAKIIKVNKNIKDVVFLLDSPKVECNLS